MTKYDKQSSIQQPLLAESSEALLAQEHDILKRVAGLPIDLRAMAVVANIWRVSQAVKLKLERELLRQYGLSWAGFSTLFIVWVWGPIEIRDLARQQVVTRATVTSNVNQLATAGLCARRAHERDKRLVWVELTPEGQRVIETLFPHFNQGETAIAQALEPDEQELLARLLRKIYSHLNA